MTHFIFKFILVNKKNLLFVASLVWAFAGSMLLFRGYIGVADSPSFLMVKIPVTIIFGLVFYLLLFRKISLKHIDRIKNNTEEKVPFYTFFNLKSYIMMFSMILLGIFLRKSVLVPFEYLALFYITMGVPLFISSIRFFYHAINFSNS